MSNVKDDRPEGVYCAWSSYPEGVSSAYQARILTIERVNGDASVTSLDCTYEESLTVLQAIQQEMATRGEK